MPCIHRNGQITGYIMQYKEVGGGVFIIEGVTGDQRETSITGLQPSTFYDMQIAAVNSVGTGPFTNMGFNASTSGTIHVCILLYSCLLILQACARNVLIPRHFL